LRGEAPQRVGSCARAGPEACGRWRLSKLLEESRAALRVYRWVVVRAMRGGVDAARAPAHGGVVVF
jgi:hypothetical protein